MKDSTSISATSVDTVAIDSSVVAADTTSSAQVDTVATVQVDQPSAKSEKDTVSYGLELMVIGMLTVFTILLIVINLGKVLIKVVNVIAPEEKVAAKKATAAPAAIDANTMAILEQTVSQITGGKGRVASAKKI